VALTELHIAYLRYGPDRQDEPHLAQILPGLSGQTVCGRPVLGYGEMLADDADNWPDLLCGECRKLAVSD
jgi:hypothetical protein